MHFLAEDRETGPAVGGDLRPQIGQIFLERGPVARLEVLDFLPLLFFLALLDETP